MLDVGCGTGRLNEFLPPDVDYLAFDTSPRMRDRCALEHPAAVMLDRLPRVAVEHVVAVGPFNLADRWSVDHTRRELEGLWRITLQTLVVSVYRGHDRACIHYTPELVARWASELSERFTVEAHMPNDLLMAVRRCG